VQLTDGTWKANERVEIVGVVEIVCNADGELPATIAVSNDDSNHRTQHTSELCANV